MASKFPLSDDSFDQHRISGRSLDVSWALRERLIVRIENGNVTDKELEVLSILRSHENVSFQQLDMLLLDAHRPDLVEIIHNFLSEREPSQGLGYGEREIEQTGGSSPTIDGINPDFLRLHSTDESHSQCRDVSTQTEFHAVEISTRFFLLGPEQENLNVSELIDEYQEREREGVEEVVRLKKEVVHLRKEVVRLRREVDRLREELRFLKEQLMESSSSSDDERMIGNPSPIDALENPAHNPESPME